MAKVDACVFHRCTYRPRRREPPSEDAVYVRLHAQPLTRADRHTKKDSGAQPARSVPKPPEAARNVANRRTRRVRASTRVTENFVTVTEPLSRCIVARYNRCHYIRLS